MKERKSKHIVVGEIIIVMVGMLFFSGMACAANIIQNPGAEEVGENNKPVFWSEYSGASYGEWGVYTKATAPENVYAGNNSVYYRPGYNKEGYSNCALVAGVSSGYTGKKAYVVTPGARYYFSFWLKASGYGREIWVMPWGWTEDDKRIRSNENSAPAGFAGSYLKIFPSNEWTKYSGSFIVPENVRTVVILFDSFGYLYKDFDEGAEFIVDEMYLSTEPEK